jgi:hypothetical protein
MENGTRTDRAAELQGQLERQIAELVSGDDWAAMLQTAARFHRYSANNVMLIMMQRPNATRVAGFNAWKTFNRFVRKGEHGIRILAPCVYKVETDDGGERHVLRGFKVVTVFDLSQTDGEDLPGEIRPVLLEGEAPAGLWDALAAQVIGAGFELVRGDCGGANGRTDYGTRTVTVRGDVGFEAAQAVKTLSHELGHILLGHESQLLGGCRGLLEVEAESVAYIVAKASGLDCSNYSLPYVAHWAGGDLTMVRKTADRVVSCAGKILADLEAFRAESAPLEEVAA